ncbi:hybrid sensor histidine kinase/response regulator [Mangrovibrevibacter kandeliae]|uniref:hybrid sensor histidine kinase/response regulator n=1 Tax=Mangrovibrevibacter kandeliae TaxID=2968473 RepID=UPI0021177744|nr:hybrid sensor histidine kinase/response regulator [Aurantimonas sp. CSK15Z-1]MCQ8783762.1 ATP-binding protein [Aurantimonas sp. CSK15Z-1]
MISKPLRSALPYAIIMVTSVLTLAMIGWYANSYIEEHRSRFRNDGELLRTTLRAEADTVLVRVKDAAAFVALGLDAEVDRKLKVASRTSDHMTGLGYIRTGSDAAVRTFVGPDIFADLDPVEFQRLQARLQENRGLVYAVTPQSYIGFSKLDAGSLIMLQTLPSAGSGRSSTAVYAVVDLDAMIAAARKGLQHSQLRQVSFQIDSSSLLYQFAISRSWLSAFIEPQQQAVDVQFTRNLSVKVDLQERFDGLTALVMMIAGLLMIGIISAGLVLFNQKISRASARRIEAALQEARKGSEAKSVFLANMSHEIRTPLNGVLGMAELLLRTDLSDPQLRYATQIKASGNILLAILNDVLDMSKIESGQLSIDPIRVRLPTQIRDIVGFYAASAQHKGLSLLIDIEANLPEAVEVDPTRLRQILGNLISNAIKFTREGEILVAVKTGSTSADGRRFVTFSVTDSGIGIPGETIARLFSRFSQAEASTTRIYGGTGLGLSICKELCTLMEGRIGVVSEEGKGSTFSFTLPLKVLEDAAPVEGMPTRIALITGSESLARILGGGLRTQGIAASCFRPTDAVAEEIAATQDAVGRFDLLLIDEGRHIDTAIALQERLRRQPAVADRTCVILGAQNANPKYAAFAHVLVKPIDSRTLAAEIRRLCRGAVEFFPDEPAVAGHRSDPARYKGRRALLVDDNNVNILFGQEVLDEFGFDIVTASNGRKAVDAAASNDFDVVFMDCQMPVMDGYTAAGILRQRMEAGELRRIPIIALTANALKGDREKCLEAGMDAFLTKPMSLDLLSATLESLEESFPLSSVPHAPATATPDREDPAMTDATRATVAASAPQAPAPSRADGPGAAAAPPPAGASSATPPVPADVAAPPAPVTRAKIPLIDVTAFRQTRAAMKKFEALVSFYSADTADYLQTIKDALALGRIEDAVMPAHTIKSSSRILGASGLAALAEEFERRARTGGATEINELNALRIHMDRLFKLTVEGIERLMAAETQQRSA